MTGHCFWPRLEFDKYTRSITQDICAIKVSMSGPKRHPRQKAPDVVGRGQSGAVAFPDAPKFARFLQISGRFELLVGILVCPCNGLILLK